MSHENRSVCISSFDCRCHTFKLVARPIFSTSYNKKIYPCNSSFSNTLGLTYRNTHFYLYFRIYDVAATKEKSGTIHSTILAIPRRNSTNKVFSHWTVMTTSLKIQNRRDWNKHLTSHFYCKIARKKQSSVLQCPKIRKKTFRCITGKILQ